MPIICKFRGISIYIQYNDHAPPHIHAKYGSDECTINLKELIREKGELPRKQLNLVLGWATLHQDELLENWELARQGEELFTIDPLK